ncbi:hypothetical protein DFS33DRAFT_1428614 [Desarmillaria ectypa]|nr:hypothetical protein DFS33DRAFT_1428614 [Desarmillaria ectypa]
MSYVAVAELKEQANNAHIRKSYRQAIQLYSQALDSTIAVEIKRQILSSRKFTLTLVIFTTRLEQCESLKKSDNASHTEIQLLIDIDIALSRPEDSDERRKDELLRALDYRGAITEENHRGTFPHHPDPYVAAMEDPSDLFEFDTTDRRPYQNLHNPDATPLCVPLQLVMSEFQHDPFHPGQACIVKTSVTEDTDMHEAVDGTLYAYFAHMLHNSGPASLSQSELIALQSRHMFFGGAAAIIITREGRFLEIPLQRRCKISGRASSSVDILVFPDPKDDLTYKLRILAEQIDRMRDIMEIEVAART